MDNVVICQEIVHSLRFTTGRHIRMISKLELEKAYDRMSWAFIKESTKDADLPRKIIDAITEILRGGKWQLL